MARRVPYAPPGLAGSKAHSSVGGVVVHHHRHIIHRFGEMSRERTRGWAMGAKGEN